MIESPRLHSSFKPVKAFQSSGYQLLPFRFKRLKAERYLLTNLVGEYYILAAKDLQRLLAHQVSLSEELYCDLNAHHFVADNGATSPLHLLAAKYRTKQARRPNLTALHLFVVTLRCEHSCHYCQVSRASEDRTSFDMTEETADRAIDLMLESPSLHLKVEFQGGEPLLNFPLIQYIVHRVQERKDGRQVQFVITSNLACLTEEMLDFCLLHGILFSTSLDGPALLHNENRPRPGRDSHAKAVEGIERIRKRLGRHAVAALMTTTQASLDQPEAIIDEYVRLGFTEIFLRPISPYGFAVKTATRIGYEGTQFLEFYQRGLAHILSLNQQGIFLRETYTTLLLRRMLTPYADGYVDLQSPAGLGLSVLAYNYDGSIYASDEGRMLAEMEDTTFRLGHVRDSSYPELIEKVLPMLSDTMTEGTPCCSECAFQPWCGSDPVFHHRTQGDLVGHRPTSAFCHRQMGVFHHLIELLETPSVFRTLQSWVPSR